VKNVYKVVCTLLIIMSQSSRADGLCIGDSVKRLLVRQLRNRVEGSKKTILLCAIRRVSSRCQRLACFSSIRKRSCSLTVNNVGCDSKDGCCRLGISVCVALFQLAHE